MASLTGNEVDHTNRVILNVGGTRFETYIQILKKIQATRLSRLTKALANYDPITDEYFFDRHPGVFSTILNYYRTGKLHYPKCVCGPLFEEELVFWGIDSNQVEPCCWKTYTKHRQTEETLITLDKLNIDLDRTPRNELITKFKIDRAPGYPNNLSFFKRIQPLVWQMFEEPRSSIPANLIAIIQISMIFLSVAVLWLSSEPMTEYQTIRMQDQFYNIFENDDILDNSSAKNDSNSLTRISSFRLVENTVSPWIIGLEYLTLAWFIIDISVRFIFSPNKRAYLIKFDNIIDIIATLSLIIDRVINIYITSFFIHSFQCIRVFRLLRLLSYHPGLKVIILSISKSVEILKLLLYFIIIASTLFGALIFYAEKLTTEDPNNNMFISIPDALWFSLVSLTTIGYGDITPVTPIGMIVGFCCVLVGVLMMSLPMTIVVEVFTNFYKHLGARSKLPKQRRHVCPVEAPRVV